MNERRAQLQEIKPPNVPIDHWDEKSIKELINLELKRQHQELEEKGQTLEIREKFAKRIFNGVGFYYCKYCHLFHRTN